MSVQDFLVRLHGVHARCTDRWSARCPAHADKSPSLSIREDNTRILLHCFGGCTPKEIVAALGLTMRDLFTDRPCHPGRRPAPKRQKLDLVALAHRFELSALDRRLRADAVLQAVGKIDGEDLSDEQRDRFMNVVARAFSDRDLAEFLEAVADDFRVKSFQKRTDQDAA